MSASLNPFRTSALDLIPYFFDDGDSVDKIWEDFLNLNMRAAITGPKGRGKTRLMEVLAPFINEAGYKTRYMKLSRENRGISNKDLGELREHGDRRTIILLDGCEQMSAIRWHLFYLKVSGNFAGILISNHRKNRLPLLRECKTSLSLLRKCVDHLTRGTGIHVSDTILNDLYLKHHGNIREVFLELYDAV